MSVDTITLKAGGHSSPEAGMCLLEAASFVAGEPFTDRPECVSRTLGAYGRALNDVLPDDKRQELVPLIRRLIGTRDDGLDERRGYIALDWLIRTYLPAFLALSVEQHADTVRALAPITDLDTARTAGAAVYAAQAAARAAAREAAAGATVYAARAAAWDAAGDAVGEAAWGAAWAAAADATGYAAREAAADAAWAAAREAAWASAGDAAWARLDPTIASLQDSAIALLRDRLIDGR